ncbi:hypothetical protein A2473_00085 [candidate division WWE3 bacterium RIFOXYC2_FULL_42_13]|uniref:DUF5659 domain-containing protein n=1 Tax=candidate division WWE3 bacterium TaxID=2053526 RepID=A0A3D0ZNV3_UNCKA|nr:MAG: hypothetical protein A2245_02330 [candidate division WWE3 bacterium RIFOXYA2_FULL_43_12]OGC66645.1 MAG: hypothetical protein A2274_01935 [candidate division WWE3 bacterium RIFOXYA12_FULL_43_11]OGC73828.1 MAG: hypothetical protein A2337_03450 [candidate division WWE3 bacterium RIFOXYB2_FULL_43_9]OGC74043.1 MAG: hypothetical protein A2473_00085 [candidate division WWE3 bacterium RIFOXYC2_FULL_42_13]OGC75620.1 MAG: hypothetical protein A2547_00845 [candidate division WWE3 bacterium RIFOXYD
MDTQNGYATKDFYLSALLTLSPETGFEKLEKDDNGSYWCVFNNKDQCEIVINNYLKNQLQVRAKDFVAAIKILKERMVYGGGR